MATDVLTVLKEYCCGRRRMKYITYKNEEYIAFDDLAFPKNTEMPIWASANKTDKDKKHTLYSLLYFWEHKDLSHSNYVKDTAAKHIIPVTRSHKRPLIEFLTNKKDLPDALLDSSFPPAAPIPVSRLRDEAGEPERKRAKVEAPAEKSQRLESLLNKKPEDQPETSQLRSLNDNLTADRIALLKKKKQMNQKKNIAAFTDPVDELGVMAGVPSTREAKWDRERVWKTRLNCMDSLTKDFANVAEMIRTLKSREESEAQQKSAAANAPPPKLLQKPRQQPGYSRYDQEIFTKEMNSDFNIDTEISFVGQNFSLNKPPPVLPIPTDVPDTVPAAKPAAAPAAKAEPPIPRKRTNRTPIIIIPGGMAGTLINMYNVRDILQDMTYKTPDEKKASGTKRDSEVQLHRKRGEVTVPYRVIENPTRLTDEEWERVVAVFVMGPTWQFKGWKWGGNPVEIFCHVPAFHLHYDDMKIDKNVAQWSVTFIPISKDKRHLDKARLAKFWDTLDRHMVKHKSHLRY